MAKLKDPRLSCIHVDPRWKDKWERLPIQLPKGKRDAYKMAAQEFGIAMSKLVQNGVEEYIKNHGKEFIKEYEDKESI